MARNIFHEPPQHDRVKRSDSRRDPSDPPQPCPLAPVPPPVPSVHVPAALVTPRTVAEQAAEVAAESRRFKDPGLRRKALALLGTAVLAGLGYLGKLGIESAVATVRANSKAAVTEAVTAAVAVTTTATNDRLSKCEARLGVLELKQERTDGNIQGYWAALGYSVRRPQNMAAPSDVEIQPKPKPVRRSPFAPKPEIILPDEP